MADVINKLATGSNAGELGGLLNKQQRDEKLIKDIVPQLRAYHDAQKNELKKNNGTTVYWFGFKDLANASETATEGQANDGVGLVPFEISKEVKQYQQHVVLTDRLIERGKAKCQAIAYKKLAKCGAKTIDGLIYKEFEERCFKVLGGAEKEITQEYNSDDKKNVALSSSTLTGTSYITANDIKKAVTWLSDHDYDKFEDGYYHCLCRATGSADVRNITGFVDVTKYQDKSKVYQGELGCYEGVKFIESSNCPRSVVYIPKTLTTSTELAGLYERTGSSAPYTYTKQTSGTASTGTYYEALEVDNYFIYGEDAYGVVDVEAEGSNGKPKSISKGLGSAGTDDPADQKATEAIKFEFAAKVLDEGDATPTNKGKGQHIVRIVAPTLIKGE